MGINSTNVAYGFGQLGSGHVRATTLFYPPTDRVIMAITMLEDVEFTSLVADTLQVDATVKMANVSFFGTGAQVISNGHDDDTPPAAASVPIVDSVVFPKGITIYGRWTSLQLADTETSGIIVYFGD
jgi:hypothetical protein